MKKIRTYVSLNIVVASLWMGCIPDPLVVEDIPAADAKIVVSSAFIPEQNLALVLSKNYGALSGNARNNSSLIERILLQNAQATVTVAGKSFPLEQVQPGLYINSDLPIIEKANYLLHVRDPETGREAAAETYMMEAVLFNSVNIERIISGKDTFPEIAYDFQDPPGKNWYMINVQMFETPEDVIETFLDARIFNYLLTDEGLDGTEISGEFLAFLGEDINIGDSIVVSLSNISQPYYNFLDKWNNRFFAIDLVSEPFNLPTNVTNGYGFFNLHIPDYRLIRVE